MLPKKNRLTTNEFKKVFKEGVRYNTPSLLCIYLTVGKDQGGAISTAITKKQYPSAVDRNRMRRIIYGCVQEVPQGKQIIILLRKKITPKEENTLCAEVSGFIHSLSV